MKHDDLMNCAIALRNEALKAGFDDVAEQLDMAILILAKEERQTMIVQPEPCRWLN